VYPNCAGFHKNPNGSSVGKAVPVAPIALREGEGFSNKNGTAASPCAKPVTENKLNTKRMVRRDVAFIEILPEILFDLIQTEIYST
jgi:hypothetical protein